jgi:hypothetical protein
MESAEFIDRKKCISCESDNIIALSSGLFNKGASNEFISNDPWGEDPAPFLKNKQWRYVKCSDCDQAFHQFILAPEWNGAAFFKMDDPRSTKFYKNLLTYRRFFLLSIPSPTLGPT